MEVQEIIRRKLEYVSPDATISEAAAKMEKNGIGALPVLDNSKWIGFLTDRDVTIRAVAKGMDPKTTKVRQVMSKNVITCNPSSSLEEAAQLMGDKHVRRLLVVDAGKKPVGIISLADIAAFSTQSNVVFNAVKHIKEYEHRLHS